MKRVYVCHWHDPRWARFRLRVLKPLLNHFPAHGEAFKCICRLARKRWRHPISGKPVQFAAVSISKWYYKARWAADPAAALGCLTRNRTAPAPTGAGVYTKAGTEAPHRQGLFGFFFDRFVEWMNKCGYSVFMIRRNLWHVTHLGRYLKRKGCDSIRELDGSAGQEILVGYTRYLKCTGHAGWIWGVRSFVRFLQEAGELTAVVERTTLPVPLLDEYAQFLRDQRGIGEWNIRTRYLFYVDRFLRFLGCQETHRSLPPFGIGDVDRFIVHLSAKLCPATIRIACGVLRGFSRFLYQTGKIDCDLAGLIEHPRQYKLQSVPTVLKWPDVEKLFGTLDCSSPLGLRDYAILRLLATYGLRAGEVAHLKLDDIDWRKETLHIVSGKTGREQWLPLTAEVGNAILHYLRRGRRPSPYREVFLTAHAPHTPIAYFHISYMVSRCIRLAGLAPPRRGAHVLRHSFATRLYRDGVPLKTVGDLLGHQDPASTHIYTKSATERLRDVALEVPEVLPCIKH